ncbi:Hpt domain-containing protein [Anaerobacillus arseniciselenatis]|uniref:Hpt domain-containing protein n=1 Tax=Anaerobacillus arseniciselenatis TaxID=85682 RepID=A0A1S2LPY3_9BACI|nr:Hpt domain-containing protein [Anaerobacillus arseniciselenatis]OIJ14541.1 Hpt domain-containing protein [Anaerobacillus arseniciselenatis]
MSNNDGKNKVYVYIDEDLVDLIPGYMTNRKKDIEKILKALTKDDFEQIQLIGHSMKGNGSGYGFDQISEIGYFIEIAAKNKDKVAIEQQLGALEDYLNKVVVIYE